MILLNKNKEQTKNITLIRFVDCCCCLSINQFQQLKSNEREREKDSQRYYITHYLRNKYVGS